MKGQFTPTPGGNSDVDLVVLERGPYKDIILTVGGKEVFIGVVDRGEQRDGYPEAYYDEGIGPTNAAGPRYKVVGSMPMDDRTHIVMEEDS
jgi:hypothetical protein